MVSTDSLQILVNMHSTITVDRTSQIRRYTPLRLLVASIPGSHFFGFLIAPHLFLKPTLNGVVCLLGSSFPWLSSLSAP